MEYNDKFPRSIQPFDIKVKKRILLIIGKPLHDFIITAMTRSIPSIIVLTLMCFTISYGLVQFPDAGILDSTANLASSARSQKVVVLKQPIDGAFVQTEQTSALPNTQASSSDLFVEETTADSANNSTVSDPSDGSSDKPAAESSSNSASAAELTAADDQKNPTETTDSNSNTPETGAENVQTQEPENSQENEPAKQEEKLPLIGIPDDDASIHGDSLPIETDQDPLPALDPLESDVPQIQVPSIPTESELVPEPEPIMEPESEPEVAPMSVEQEQAVDQYWNDYFDENTPANSLASNKGNSQSDSASSTTEAKTPEPSEPTTLKTDPNAQEIPAKNREQKSANTDVLTLPALDEPQNNAPEYNQPDTGTIPLETFPLDANSVKPVNYTADNQQEMYSQPRFNNPGTRTIVIKRFPPIENSIDPIYNNAQLDKFAL